MMCFDGFDVCDVSAHHLVVERRWLRACEWSGGVELGSVGLHSSEALRLRGVSGLYGYRGVYQGSERDEVMRGMRVL